MAKTKLEKLDIDEISGVGNPANEMPFWLVQKGRELLKDVDRAEHDMVILYAALQKADDYTTDAPEEVRKASEVLQGYVSGILAPSADDEAEDTEAAPDEAEEPVEEATKSSDDDDEVENDDDEQEPVEKDGLSLFDRLRRHLGSAEVAKEESDADPPKSPKPGNEEEPVEQPQHGPGPSSTDLAGQGAGEDGDGPNEEPDSDLAKSARELEDENKKLASALEKTLDRVERLEAGRKSLDGQEGELEKGQKGSALAGAFARAAKGERITIT